MGMAMNGLDPSHGPERSDPMEPSVITVNLGIKARHIMWAATIVGGMISSGALAGYVFIPAKDRDVKALEIQVQQIGTRLDSLQPVVLRLTEAVDALARNVQDLVERPDGRPVFPVPTKRPVR